MTRLLASKRLRRLLVANCAFVAVWITMSDINALYLEAWLGWQADDIANVISLNGWASLAMLLFVMPVARRLPARLLLALGLSLLCVSALCMGGAYYVRNHSTDVATYIVCAGIVLLACGSAVAPLAITSLIAGSSLAQELGQGVAQGSFSGISSVSNGLLPFFATLWYKHTSSRPSPNPFSAPPSTYLLCGLVGAFGALCAARMGPEEQ